MVEPAFVENVRTAALRYLRRGWQVVPVPRSSKHPVLRDWPNLRISEAEVASYFEEDDSNIGLLLGDPSAGLVDVDLDVLEALAIADVFLPKTGLVHGRESKPRSHRWYTVTGQLRSEQFRDHDGRMLVELRGSGLQTIVPPSVHPTGETILWDPEGVPLEVSADVLRRQVALLAACALLARHWPTEGSRQDAALALSGGLLRSGYSVEETVGLIGAVARAAHDEEQKKRIEAARDTAKRHAAGTPVTGWPALAKILSRPVLDRVHEFLRLTPRFESAEPSPSPNPKWPDPPSEEAFYGLAGKFVRTIEPHTESDPVAILAQTLVAFGSVIGRGAHFRHEGDVHYTNLFVTLVGKTAKARKGTSWGQVRRFYSEIDPEWSRERVQSGLSSGEGLIWAVRDPIEKTEPIREKGRVIDYQTYIGDHGVSDKRLQILESEFAAVLKVQGREGSILSTTLRDAWDTGDLRILNKNSPGKATGAHISVIGHITGEELHRSLDETEKANGFANRFLWLCVRRSKQLPDGGRLNQVELQPFLEELKDAVAFARTAGEMNRDEGARQVWHRVYGELSEGRPGLLGAILARAEPQVMRLACVYALLDRSRAIRKEHLLAALALWEYCEESCRFIFGDALGDPVADELYRELLKRPHGMTRTEMRDHFGRNRTAEQIGQALRLLEEHGLAVHISEPTGGRTAERWIATRYVGGQEPTAGR